MKQLVIAILTIVGSNAFLPYVWSQSDALAGALAEAQATPNDADGPDTLSIPIHGDTITWQSLGMALADRFHIDTRWFFSPSPFAPGIPKDWFDHLSSLSDGLMTTQSTRDGNVVSIDVAGWRQRWREFSKEFRDRMAERKEHVPAYIEKLESTWSNNAPDRVVVLLSGFQSTSEGAHAVAKAIHSSTGEACLLFHYPNDAPVDESAKRFSEALQQAVLGHPKMKISLIGHSMGGLVAREAVESGQLDQLLIDQLIQVLPPNHGSELADYAGPLEVIEHVYRLGSKSSRDGLGPIAASILDGMGEAKKDLRPDSSFLRELNARPRKKGVRYTVLAGSEGPVRGPGMAVLSVAWNRLKDEVQELKAFESRVDRILQCEELRRGKGDGIVSIRSAKLQDVDDFVIVPCHHLSWGKSDSKDGAAIETILVDRLRSIRRAAP